MSANYVGRDARRLGLPPDCVAVVALVAMKHAGSGKLGQQRRGGGAVRHLTADQQEVDRPALTARERVDLGRSSAARAIDRQTESIKAEIFVNCINRRAEGAWSGRA